MQKKTIRALVFCFFLSGTITPLFLDTSAPKGLNVDCKVGLSQLS